MKFFWKIFFTTMFICVTCVSLSGYWLITSSFNSQFESETQTAIDYTEIIYYSMEKEFIDLAKIDFSGISEQEILEIATDTIQYIGLDNSNEKVAFNVLNTDGDTIFSSLHIILNKDLISSTSSGQTAWVLVENGNAHYLQAMRPISCFDTVFYIETVRDVTSIFTMRDTQFEMMIKILIVMIFFAGILTFIVSKLLIRRITNLTKVTQAISEGNLSERARTRGRDEIGQLSKNFNQMADHLENKIHELKDESERKELFVGSFSHELKTPLTSIIGYADLLRRKEMSAKQRYTCANYIFKEGKRLEQMSMRLLELIVLKKQEISPIPVSIKSIFKEVCSVMAPQIKSAGIQMTLDLESAIIPMEPELMKTVFINIIDNARNALETGGTIQVTGRIQDSEYVLTIQDSGKGMEKEELSKITDAFYMVDKSRSRKRGGAGLGLSICSEILNLHDFGIHFSSIVDVGTTVTLTMKVIASEEIDASAK